MGGDALGTTFCQVADLINASRGWAATEAGRQEQAEQAGQGLDALRKQQQQRL